jgi:glycerol-3-phosphate dehydrogenase (NAD(P)+)
MKEKIAVIGNGGWGTTLGLLLFNKGYDVDLWGVDREYVFYLREKKENVKFLPGITLPEGLKHTSDFKEALQNASFVVMAVPSPYMGQVAGQLKSYFSRDCGVISVAKGIEVGSNKRMSEILKEVLNPKSLAILSGPSHAEEVVRGVPTSVVVASENDAFAQSAQKLFMTDRFRVYTNSDVTGVELGGALKNVISVAAGISDGLGFGDNTKAALVTRGLAEMTRLGVAMGAKKETFSGLAGVGDLITTAFSSHGRNRKMGELIGQGINLEEALKTTEMVAEGVKTCVAVVKLAEQHRLEMPISQKVYQVLYEGLNPKKAVQELMLREAKPEA